MQFNKKKSMLIFHTHFSRWDNEEEYKEIKIVKHTKVLGYIIDSKINCKKHIEHIE